MADGEKYPQSDSNVAEARALSTTARLRPSASAPPSAKRKPGGDGGPISPDLIFVGYSHDSDERWLQQVLLPFKPSKAHGLIEVFSDQSLKGGDRWHPRIQAHIQRAKVAILLIDSHFLASSYCLNDELTPLLERQERGELEIIPLLVERCHWMLFPSLQSLQIQTFNKMALAEIPPNLLQAYLSDFAWEVLESLGVTPPEDPDPDQPNPGAPNALVDQSVSVTGLLDGKRRFGRPRDVKGFDVFPYYGIAWPDLVAERPIDVLRDRRADGDLHDLHLGWPAGVDGEAEFFVSGDELRKFKVELDSGISGKPRHVLVFGGGGGRTGESTLALLLKCLKQEPIFVDRPLRLPDGTLDRAFNAHGFADFIGTALRDMARLAADDLHLWLDGPGNTAEADAFNGQRPMELARIETVNYDGLIDLTWDREEERWVHPGTLPPFQSRVIQVRSARVNNMGYLVEIPLEKLDFGRVLYGFIADGRSIFVDPKVDHDFKCTFLEVFSIDEACNLAEDFRGDGGWPPIYIPVVDLTNTCRSTGELLPF